MIAVEPCPPLLASVEWPTYGGSLHFHSETGKAGCTLCGWKGAPTVIDGFASTWCPSCQRLPDEPPRVRKVARNTVCPCGSGMKAKRCRCTGYTV